MNISLVLPTYNRDTERLDRLLRTTEWQLAPFHEVVVVDGSTFHGTLADNREACEYRARHLPVPLSEINFPLLYNVGIRATSRDTDYIACTCVDMLFDPSFTLALSKLLGDGIEFTLSQGAILPQFTDYTDFGTEGHWKYLISIARRRFPLGHGVLCAHRTWWFHIRGFDETFSGGLGVYDGDVRKRAQKHGLKMGHALYSDAPLLHQWHPKSPLKHHNRPRRDDDPQVIKNPGGWGEV